MSNVNLDMSKATLDQSNAKVNQDMSKVALDMSKLALDMSNRVYPRCTGSKRIMRNRLRQVQGRSGQLPGSRVYRGEIEYSTRTVSKRKIYKYLISTREYRGETDREPFS